MLLGLKVYFLLSSRDKIFASVSEIPETTYWENALVLGAGLRHDGTPTRVLQDRVVTAVDLYHQGKVKRLILSGANRGPKKNEAKAMARAAEELGVPQTALILDENALTTLENCQQSAKRLQIKQAIVVSQGFHLPRALYLCEHFGIKSIGLRADRGAYSLRAQITWHLRELFANLKAFWQTAKINSNL